MPSEHSTRAPTASRSPHGMHRDPEHPGEGNSAAAWELPNPLPEWCSGRKADVGRLLEWWECGRDGTPPIREWTSQQLQHCVRKMSANEKQRFNKWKLQFSQDYIMVHTKISEKLKDRALGTKRACSSHRCGASRGDREGVSTLDSNAQCGARRVHRYERGVLPTCQCPLATIGPRTERDAVRQYTLRLQV